MRALPASPAFAARSRLKNDKVSSHFCPQVVAALQTIGLVDSNLIITADPRYTKLPWRQLLPQVSACGTCVARSCAAGTGLVECQAAAGSARASHVPSRVAVDAHVDSANPHVDVDASLPQMVPELSAAANDSLAADTSAVSGEGTPIAHLTAARSRLGQRQGKQGVLCRAVLCCAHAAPAALLTTTITALAAAAHVASPGASPLPRSPLSHACRGAEPRVRQPRDCGRLPHGLPGLV